MSIHTRAEHPRDIPVAILDAVGDCHGIEERDIDRQLADVIDPDRLSHLWPPEDTDDQGCTARFPSTSVSATLQSVATVVSPPLGRNIGPVLTVRPLN